MEGMRENKTWFLSNIDALHEMLSEILYRDLPLEIFKEIEVSLSNFDNKKYEITAVLFLICPKPITSRLNKLAVKKSVTDDELGIVLNKRSRYVIQPGDLCFPGGGIKKPLDKALSFFTGFLLNSISRYPAELRKVLSLLFATALREAWEEVRLNPFRVKICGVLSPYRLIMFRKTIVPVVGLIKPPVIMLGNSHEVEKIVWIPFSELMDSDRYARYRLYNYPPGSQSGDQYQDFLCFIHQDGVATEILWGATFRMVMDFMSRFFEFFPPPAETLPIVPGILSDRYLSR